MSLASPTATINSLLEVLHIHYPDHEREAIQSCDDDSSGTNRKDGFEETRKGSGLSMAMSEEIHGAASAPGRHKTTAT